MIVRQYAPCSLGRSIICLGKQGEINALRVEFDVSAWMAMYPDATVKLMHFAPDRPQDNPVIPTLGVEGTLRVWIVGEEDTAGAGNGVIELLLIDERTGSTIKSATGYTTVLRSPSAGIEAQEPEPGYVRYDVDQSALLTDTQKAFARTNIDAIKDEKDPTVPDWAKQPSKPTYTASEVGALPSSYTPPVTSVNGKTGAVALSAQDVGARPDTWTPSASDVGADAAGTASGAVAAHNVSGAAHADLRALIEGLTRRLNALADSDDTTLDQLSEIVAYIKSNKALIDAVTTGKVSVSDIVDNLTTNASGKVLSAAQGVALKAMIDGIVIPTALPNPQPITINGQRYDGSEAVTVTTAEIDDTLTQSGKAADAKAVGDQLSTLNEATAEEVGQLKSDIGGIKNEIFDPTSGILQNNVRLNKLARTETVLNLFNKATSVDGYALSESGQLYASVEYTVSDFILLPSKSKVYVYCFDGTTVIKNQNVYICFYTYNKEMTGTRIQSNYVTDVPVGAKYIRIAPSIQRKDTVMLFANDEPCAPSEYVQYMDGVNNKFAFEDKIAEMEETLSGFTPIVKEVADNLNLASFEKGTAISKNATYNTYYIHTNGNLSSLGEQNTNYNVFEYRLEANKKYVLSGRVALNGDLPLFGVKDTSGTSGKVTILKSIGKNYEDVYIEYTAEKDEYLFVAAYSIRGELLVYNSIVSYDYNDVVRARSIQSITNPWYGKKVVWLGTSVPAGQYADTSYAYEVAKYLGINLVNTSIPGLSIHLNENGEPRLSPYAGSSSATIAEYEAVGVTIPTSKTASGYYKSYEHIFEEENADADLYVFDVAPNNGNFDMSDWDAFNKNTWAYNDGTPFSEHRKTFLGALLFLMDKMYTLNPKARMVFVLGSSFAYTNGKEAFETVSAQWNIPIINVWEKINTSPKSLPIIKSKDGTDNHPSTYAHQCMGKMLIGEFLKIG